jgi:hypothetical protein
VEAGQAEGRGATGGQLDRQREPVEPGADGSDQVEVRLLDHQPGVGPAGPVDEQLDHLGAGSRGCRGLDGERVERQHLLARQPEAGAGRDRHGRSAAGAQHPHDQGPHLVEDVLGAVEHQSRALAGDPGHQLSLQVRADERQPRRRGDRARHLPVGGGGQLRHHGGSVVALEGLGQQARLAHAAGTHDGDQRLGAEVAGQPVELLRAAHEGPQPRQGRRAGRRRRRSGGGPAGLPRLRCLARQDLPLQLGQLRARLQAGLLRQPAPVPVGRPQRLGRAARTREGPDQEQLGRLPQRLPGGGPLELRHRPLGLTGVDESTGLLLDQQRAQLGQAGGVGAERGHGRQLAQRLAPPPGQGRLQQPGHLGGIARGPGPRLEQPHLTHVGAVLGQPVAAGAVLDHAVADLGPEPGHVALDRPPRVRRGLAVVPHGVGERVDRHGLALCQRQGGEERPLLAAAHRHDPAGDAHLERSEQVDLDHVLTTRPAPAAGPPKSASAAQAPRRRSPSPWPSSRRPAPTRGTTQETR